MTYLRAKALIRLACFGTALRQETFSHRGGTADLSATLEMTILFADRIPRFHERSAETFFGVAKGTAEAVPFRAGDFF